MTVQDAFLTQLDPIWAPKRVPRGAQDEPKTDPRRVQNRVQNRSEKMIEKWTAQGSMTRIEGGHARPQVPTGGVGGDQPNQPEDQYPRSSTPLGRRPGEFNTIQSDFYCFFPDLSGNSFSRVFRSFSSRNLPTYAPNSPEHLLQYLSTIP